MRWRAHFAAPGVIAAAWALCASPSRVASIGRFGCFLGASGRFERFWSISDYNRYISAYANASSDQDIQERERLGLRHIFFVVKASKLRAEFAIRMYKVWTHAASRHLFLVDDLIEGLPQHAQVVINDGRDETDPGRRDPVAISRLLIWLRQAKPGGDEQGSLPGDVHWLAFLGDDVFVNLARLYHLLSQLPPAASTTPLVLAHVLSNVEASDSDSPCVGGGLTLLNRAALSRVATVASCKECPYVGGDSVALGFCASFNAVPIVHVPSLHCSAVGQADDLLVDDMLAHQWVAAGGLSRSAQGASADAIGNALLPYHPFERDFPHISCDIPTKTGLTAHVLFEHVATCLSRSPVDTRKTLVGLECGRDGLHNGDELLPDSIGAEFDRRWPGGESPTSLMKVELVSLAFAGDSDPLMGLRDAVSRSLLSTKLQAAGVWRFFAFPGTWLHKFEVARHVELLQLSGILDTANDEQLALAFAFAPHGAASLDLRAGILLNAAACMALATSHVSFDDGGSTLAAIRAHNITIVHTPSMVPDARALPRDLRGMVSEGSASGSWSIGDLRSDEMVDDLEAKARGRRYFAGLLEENFEDWMASQDGLDAIARGECGADPAAHHVGKELSDSDVEALQVEAARSWITYLHDSEEHIRVMRQFKPGRREFRTLFAWYRSEATEGLPMRGINPDTVLAARACPTT